MKRRMVPFIMTVSIVFILGSCMNRGERLVTDSRIAMDTIVSISVVSHSKDDAHEVIDTIFDEMERLGDLVNFYSEKSEISMINENAGVKPVAVSPETLEIIRESIAVAKMTKGAFDPTTGAVTILWDFHKKTKPDDKELQERLKLVSYKNVVINEDKQTVFLKKKGMMIDLGGIAKGHAADKAIEMLLASGIEAALVSIAGDIRAYGLKPDGKPWRIGIRDPRPKSPVKNILAVLPIQDKAISTSGDYERFFEFEGIRYHHILSPKTGMPSSDCQSVTVITDRAVLTDSLATAVFVLGPDKGLTFLKKNGYEGVIIDAEGRLHLTDGLRDIIEIKRTEK